MKGGAEERYGREGPSWSDAAEELAQQRGEERNQKDRKYFDSLTEKQQIDITNGVWRKLPDESYYNIFSPEEVLSKRNKKGIMPCGSGMMGLPNKINLLLGKKETNPDKYCVGPGFKKEKIFETFPEAIIQDGPDHDTPHRVWGVSHESEGEYINSVKSS
jgi:hypothetical protein